MKVKLQPPSGTELASFNPLLPPPSITQIMLLANPLKVPLMTHCAFISCTPSSSFLVVTLSVAVDGTEPVWSCLDVFQEKVRMRYKLMFTLGEQPFTEVGEVNQFPPADQWGAL